MKTINYLLMISAAVLGAACTESVDAISLPEKEITLTATRENLDPGTKSFRLDDGSVWWSPKEEVSVFYGSGTNGGSKFSTMNTSIAETVELQGSVQMSGSAKDFWAVYPYSEDNSCDGTSVTTVIPSCQTGVEGNFSNDVFPSVAKSSTMNLAFWNICGGIKFFVSRGDIKSVIIKGNRNEPLAGKVKVTFGPDGTPVVQEVLEPSTEVTLTAPEGEAFKPGTYYYITLLPTSLDGGITITFVTETKRGELVSDKAQTIKRSTFGVLKNIDAEVQDWETTMAEPEYVDLGLSVKWASFNLGASKPEEYGEYFAWGELEPKADYSWSTYKFELGTGSKGPFSKYVSKSNYGTADYKTVLDIEDDAAHVKWGDSWRMPTEKEWTELKEKCTWIWTSQNGVTGKMVTGPNGNSIFLPAAGGCLDANLYDAGSLGLFWSSSLTLGIPYDARYFYFSSGGVSYGSNYRFLGFSVRPVYGEFFPVESISLNKYSLELNAEDTQKLTATVSPSNANAKEVLWASSDESVATVAYGGLVTAVAKGTATISAYSSNGLSASCDVIVNEKPTINGYDFVDLGLPSGLKWATINVGASKPEEYGEYFAWGETKPKDDYSWLTYKFRVSGDSYKNVKLNKYCNKSTYWDSSEPMDNKTVLDPEDDAARVNWGGSWRIPTSAEWEELMTDCTWTWTAQNGVYGELVTGSNGKSIFLPAAGSYNNALLEEAGSWGGYWSASIFTNLTYDAWVVLFDSEEFGWSYMNRYFGFSVRPISE